MNDKRKVQIGFVGQGWIGKNYADEFSGRGFSITRYSQEEGYIVNKDKIAECDIVFIAVPTPTTPAGFDDRVVKEVVKLVGKGKIAVIKSTILPGTTKRIQSENRDIIVLHSPEFLSEATARHDAGHPMRNIVGIPLSTSEHRQAAERVLSILPEASFKLICDSDEAEIIKYGANTFFYVKIVYMNMLYDLSQKHGADWNVIKSAFLSNPWMGNMHFDPVHKSGRGAGGSCFIKDFAAFSKMIEKELSDKDGYLDMLHAIEKVNLALLISTSKDLKLIQSVYGEEILKCALS
ncbi:MAG: UDP-glucose/GDP-mannose dehydrogenase family protein [Candidatus Taylorbacteria bacterium]|nr:UDP-glucose/GDP-mannose dehydrogenase family protein [Candidatus Taylorbacteria bacterium]